VAVEVVGMGGEQVREFCELLNPVVLLADMTDRWL